MFSWVFLCKSATLLSESGEFEFLFARGFFAVYGRSFVSTRWAGSRFLSLLSGGSLIITTLATIVSGTRSVLGGGGQVVSRL
jgi:hypothetical protein